MIKEIQLSTRLLINYIVENQFFKFKSILINNSQKYELMCGGNSVLLFEMELNQMA